jgi:aryl-alcohol dehydrogenase-like predicted oxidoreductase
MTLIDTSGNYGGGRSEELIKRVIVGQRDRAFVVSKVEANDATREAMARACEASLTRLGTDYLDLYLLHFPVSRSIFGGRRRIRTAARGGQNSVLGRVQLLSPPNGRPIPYSTRRSLRDQSGPL